MDNKIDLANEEFPHLPIHSQKPFEFDPTDPWPSHSHAIRSPIESATHSIASQASRHNRLGANSLEMKHYRNGIAFDRQRICKKKNTRTEIKPSSENGFSRHFLSEQIFEIYLENFLKLKKKTQQKLN